MEEFFALAPPEFDSVVTGWGWPEFRARQVRHWVYERLITDPQRMSNLAKPDRDRLRERISFDTASSIIRQKSSDGTQKLLITWPSGANAETVMIPDGQRRTACVSSQVGCPVGCTFCASGVGGAKGNLSAGQIVEQVFQLDRTLAPSRQRISNIVFMGMGEPLANYANVIRAVRILHDPACFNIGARRITISTVGVPQKMRQLAREELPLNLALSLHAPSEGLRKQLIPWAEHFALDDILDAARDYFEKTGREITFEYILLAGVNDQPHHARQLAQICKSIRANVNLLRYNEVDGLPFTRPETSAVMNFQNELRQRGVNAHVRKSRGRDIDAACGQLRRRHESSPIVQLGGAKGFTLVELLVAFGILIILLTIFVPYILSIRESSNRTRCADNLRQIRNALQAYALDSDHNLPSVRYDQEHRLQGYVAYSGPDDPDPFAAGTTVQPNDVTASLWLLVRKGLIPDTVVFVCPSTNDWRDRIADAGGRVVPPTQRSNFRGPDNLSYSYASPFSMAPGYRLNTDWLNSEFALMADKNPGKSADGDDVTGPGFSDDSKSLSRANSNNHRKAGQNVLYPAGNVEFVTTPYAGVSYGQRGRDNIYTARAAVTTTQPLDVPVATNGFFGQNLSPAATDDSYLVPGDDDPISPPRIPTTAPTTEPVTAPSAPATVATTESS